MVDTSLQLLDGFRQSIVGNSQHPTCWSGRWAVRPTGSSFSMPRTILTTGVTTFTHASCGRGESEANTDKIYPWAHMGSHGLTSKRRSQEEHLMRTLEVKETDLWNGQGAC